MKTHLRQSSEGYGACFPACNRHPSTNSTPHCVSPKEFKKDDNTCKYCEGELLKRRNRQRKLKGLPPVENFND